jgi:hypothetical protein
MADDNTLKVEIDALEDKAALQPKLLHAGDQFAGQPYLLISEDAIALVGDDKNVVNVNPDFGVQIGGKVSLSAMPDQVSFGGGYWRVNPTVLSCLPSTTPTPVPWLVKSVPELLRGADDATSGLEAAEASV